MTFYDICVYIDTQACRHTYFEVLPVSLVPENLLFGIGAYPGKIFSKINVAAAVSVNLQEHNTHVKIKQTMAPQNSHAFHAYKVLFL